MMSWNENTALAQRDEFLELEDYRSVPNDTGRNAFAEFSYKLGIFVVVLLMAMIFVASLRP